MKWFVKGSIRRKLAAVITLTTFIALAIAGIALLVIDLRGRANAAEKDIATQAEVVALSSSAALAFDDRRVAGENLRVLRARPNVVAAAIFDAKGSLFASYKSEPDSEIPQHAAQTGAHIKGDSVIVWRPIRDNGEILGMVYVQARHELGSRALEYLGVLLVVLASSLAAALLASRRLRDVITKPMLSISGVARQVQEGHFELRAPRTSDDEIGELADAFNAMLDELALRAGSREMALKALRVSDERYQLAVKGSSAGLWDWDMEQDTMFYSPRFRALLGYSKAEFPDTPESLRAIVHPEDRPETLEVLRAHLEEDKPYSVECRLKLKSGEWRWFLITGMAQKDEKGHPFRMAGSMIDVTERKLAERELRDASRAKDEFIATLAHELRNPLAPIRTGLDILRHDRGQGPASERARQTMERQLSHMVRMIDDLLDISRINSGKIRLEKSRTSLASAVESAVEVSRPTIEARGHELALSLPTGDIELMADGTRIAQALGNLLNNAAKYTPPGGHIRLSVRQEGTWAVIEVADDGVGIPADMLEGIFHLFTQVGRTLDHAQGGLGIGLFLVRSLVEMHAGTVAAASDGPGKGSVFTVRLPCLAPREEAAEDADSDPSQPGVRGIRVLVVDDNVDAADTLCTVLEMTGRKTRAVYEGNAVLEAARQFDPAVILLDIGLPGLSGYEVAKQLRADPRFAHTYLVAVTGWGSAEDRRKSRDAGFDDHLTKPVELGVLEPILRKVGAQAGTHSPREHPGRG